MAIKVLDKQLMTYDLEQIVEEVKILTKLDHPNIVRYFETYNDSRYIYLVMELVSGKQLLDKICEQQTATLNEHQVCHYMS